MRREYYEAYDDRYRQVHSEGLQWFDDAPSPIVMETMREFNVSPQSAILELGCGEGRDAFALLARGYNLLATDISPEAIRCCQSKKPEFTSRFQVLDCVRGTLARRFDFLYAIAVLHMLVRDEDRAAFYAFLRTHLAPGGLALVCTMGDGETERQSDIRTAFTLQPRIHAQTGRQVEIAATSCRMVSFAAFEREWTQAGLCARKTGVTKTVPGFSEMMYAVLSARS